MLPTDINFLFFDYETFGKETAGAVSQFAAIRANSEFSEVERFNFFCKPSLDVVPDPVACLITKVTPQLAEEKGICEFEFAHRVNNIFTDQKKTVVVGFNNISFDDEVSRNMFYRNMIDPYRWAYGDNNSRYDASNLVRLVHALAPDALNWVTVDKVDDEGNVVGERLSFKLEHLSAANGIVHENAHDALSDVIALQELMKLIHQRVPELFEEFFRLRDKDMVSHIASSNTFGYTSFKFSKTNYISIMKNLGASVKDKNKRYAWDLRVDPEWFANLTQEKLEEVMAMRFAELEENGYPKHGLHAIKINALPFVFDVKHFGAEGVAANAGLADIRQDIRKHIDFLSANPDFVRRVINVLASREYDPLPDDTDLNLYCQKNGGFFSPAEKNAIDRFNNALNWIDKLAIHDQLEPECRLQRMMFRIIGRNEPSVFSQEQKTVWGQYVTSRIRGEEANSFVSIDQFFEILDSEETRERFPVGENESVYAELNSYGQQLKSRSEGLISVGI